MRSTRILPRGALREWARKMKLVEQDVVTALMLTEPEREILRKALMNVKPRALEPALGVVVEAAAKLLTRVRAGWTC